MRSQAFYICQFCSIIKEPLSIKRIIEIFDIRHPCNPCFPTSRKPLVSARAEIGGFAVVYTYGHCLPVSRSWFFMVVPYNILQRAGSGLAISTQISHGTVNCLILGDNRRNTPYFVGGRFKGKHQWTACKKTPGELNHLTAKPIYCPGSVTARTATAQRSRSGYSSFRLIFSV